MQLKSPKMLSHDRRPTTILVGVLLADIKRRFVQRDVSGLIKTATDVISSSDPSRARRAQRSDPWIARVVKHNHPYVRLYSGCYYF